MTEINVGNIVRLKKDFECYKGDEFIYIHNRAPLEVLGTDYKQDVEWC